MGALDSSDQSRPRQAPVAQGIPSLNEVIIEGSSTGMVEASTLF